MSLVAPSADMGTTPAESTPVAFENAVKRVEAKELFEQRASVLRQDFEAHCRLQNTRFEIPGGASVKASKRVGGPSLERYLKGVGDLIEQASTYEWEADKPRLYIELKSLAVEGRCSFADAVLPGLELEDVLIEGDLDFTGVRLLGHAALNRVTFLGKARFDHTLFAGIALAKVSFRERVGFESACFQAFSSFHECSFLNKSYFDQARFLDGVTFDDSVFQEDVSFSGATFLTLMSWKKTRFEGEALFDSVTFSGTARFNESVFLEPASFCRSSFEGADYSDAVFEAAADFSGASFGGNARFLNTKFKNETLFIRASFAQCPRFHGTEVHQDTSFGQARMRSMRLLARPSALLSYVPPLGLGAWRRQGQESSELKKQGYPRLFNWNAEARAYRTLKLHMSKHQAQHEAAHFFAGEMRCRRRENGLRQPVLYIVSLLYDLFSEFGQSAGRVLLWLLIINGVFTYGYYLQAQQDVCALQPSFILAHSSNETAGRVAAWDATRPWLALSLQSLNPVAFLSPKNTWVAVHDGQVFLAGAGQSLANLTLIILLGISLRGQFRRGAGGGD